MSDHDAVEQVITMAWRAQLDSFRREARKRKVGYQTLINEILAHHARKDVA